MVANQKKHVDGFRWEVADYVISTGRPVTQVYEGLGRNSKTVDDWVLEHLRELAGEPDPRAEGRELREARERMRELEMENAFLRRYEQNIGSPFCSPVVNRGR